MSKSLKNGLEKNCESVAKMLKALAHSQRLIILCNLLEGEKCVNELLNVCKISQSQLSQFLNRLAREEILKSRKEGNQVFYFLKDENMRKLIKSLHDIYG